MYQRLFTAQGCEGIVTVTAEGYSAVAWHFFHSITQSTGGWNESGDGGKGGGAQRAGGPRRHHGDPRFKPRAAMQKAAWRGAPPSSFLDRYRWAGSV
jgi:hypothetical protein